MQNAFLTSVLAGIIVALVGGIIAFYLGGVRERRKRVSERREELSEQRATALAELRNQAYAVVDALNSWTFEISKSVERFPGRDRKGRLEKILPMAGQQYRAQWLAVAEQGIETSNAIESLRENYRIKQPYLESTAQITFEAFDEKVTRTYNSLSIPLRDYADGASLRTYAQRLSMDISRGQMLLANPNISVQPTRPSERADKHISTIKRAVRSVQPSDDLRGHLARLDAEVDKAARRRSEA